MILEKQCFKPTVVVFSNVIGSVIQFVNTITSSMYCSSGGGNRDNVNHILSIFIPITVAKYQAEVPLNPYSNSKKLYFKAIGVYTYSYSYSFYFK